MDTIFALSSGTLPSGIAVIRVSGPLAGSAIEAFRSSPALELEPRKAILTRLCDPGNGEPIDTGLILWFPGPSSFTGEDVAEFHLHGGRAVVDAMIEVLSSLSGFRMAEAGEFSRRAFENGKLDLVQAEGLADLIAARTRAQKRLAQLHSEGIFSRRMEEWREVILRSRALIEAELDFPDEDDVPDSASDRVWPELESLRSRIVDFLGDGRRGEIVRDGYRVAVMGKPNAGKSSLVNSLSGREIAIVSEAEGTTRDLLEAHIDLDGYEVILADMAGLRESDDPVELEGMRRARSYAGQADLIVWLHEAKDSDEPEFPVGVDVVAYVSKDDSGEHERGVSVLRDGGLSLLLEELREKVGSLSLEGNSVVLSRLRHRAALSECVEHLSSALEDSALELRAEHLRRASDCIGRVVGKVDVEELLDRIFGEFCVGK